MGWRVRFSAKELGALVKAMSEEEAKLHSEIHDIILANAHAKLGALLARRALDRAGGKPFAPWRLEWCLTHIDDRTGVVTALVSLFFIFVSFNIFFLNFY